MMNAQTICFIKKQFIDLLIMIFKSCNIFISFSQILITKLPNIPKNIYLLSITNNPKNIYFSNFENVKYS